MTFKLSLKELKSSLPPNVNLLAVSKGQNNSSIRKFIELGQLDFGESRVQEAIPKIMSLKDIDNVRWHFIGKLQRNKVRAVVKEFDVIHSVDSLALAQRISRVSGEEGMMPEVMLQVKFAKDPSKGGFGKDELIENWPQIIALPNINFIGLMTIPPLSIESKDRQSLFKDCRALADYLELKDCSMGMSNDWKDAIKFGATWIRVGALLFGKRSK